MTTSVDIRKSVVFSIRFCWISACRHPFVAGFLLFMLFLYKYFPSIFIFLVYYSPVIACTSLLLGALLVYGEPYITEPDDVKSLVVSSKGELDMSEENFRYRRMVNDPKDGFFNQMHDDGAGEANTVSGSSSSRKNTEKEKFNEKTLVNEGETRDLNFIEMKEFSVESLPEFSRRTAEGGLKVEIEKPLDNHFETSLGSPWQQVNGRGVSSSSESDEEESSSSPDTSVTDIAPIIDELNPLLESENLLQEDHRSFASSDGVSRASSPEHDFDDGSADEEAEIQADEEDEEAQEEKDNTESVVKWTADDEKNLMDLGTSELERNRRLENLIAKRRAKKLQRFQTDKNLIDLDSEPLPFMDEISRLNVQIPTVSAPRCNPFDLPYDSEENIGLPPIPGSAPSVLLPRRNPFDLPFDLHDESNKTTGESSRTYPDPSIKPYFIADKKITSLERQLSEKSDSKESSVSSESNSETHERSSSLNQDVETVDQRSDLSVQVGSEQEQNLEDSVEQEIGDMDSISPTSSSTNIEVIDERYHGSSSSSCAEEDDKCNEPVKPGVPVKGSEGVDDGQVADPVYDSSPSAQSTISHIPSLDEDLFSKFKGKEGFVAGSPPASDMEANLLEVSNSDMNIVKSFHVEGLLPEIEVPELESNSNKGLNNWIEDSCTEEQSKPVQFLLINPLDRNSAMEQPRELGSDVGSSCMSFDGKFEVNKSDISEPSAVDRSDPVKNGSQETAESSRPGSTVDNSEEDSGKFSKPLNSKDQIDLLL